MSTKLSKHFSLEEMTVTTTGIANQPASKAILDKLRDVCENVLEPVRDHFGKSIVVHSGYRSPAVNTAVKGAASSQHCKGEAVDFHLTKFKGSSKYWPGILSQGVSGTAKAA